MRVHYRSECGVTLVADVLQRHLEEALASHEHETHEILRQVYRRIVRALESAALLTKQGYVMTAKEQQDTADDIGLWFSYEVRAGRASFVPTKTVEDA